jgi:UDP-N-acetylglucosamine 2-epimerase (non-hydrolysing)
MSARKALGIVVGTRPNFVKAAALIAALNRRGVQPALIHTGQHHDELMSASFFDRLGLPAPDHHLGVHEGSRGQQLGAMVERLSGLLPLLHLDELVVVGDVTSTAAGALAADACDVPVAHVEAGLRSFDLSMPEERNRLIVDAIARPLFASEPSGMVNLLHEGHPKATVHHVGNVMIDTLMRFRDDALRSEVCLRHNVVPRKYALATLHRPSNVDDQDALAECLEIFVAVSRRMPVIFSAHPRTRRRLADFQFDIPPAISLIPPLDYLDFISLTSQARLVLTDSGGAQEETSILRVPCLTLRENTERPVTVTEGTSRLVGRNLDKVHRALSELDAGTYPKGSDIALWDGHAGDRIADILLGDA